MLGAVRSAPATLLQFGKLVLDTSARTLTADSVEVPLTNIEFRLLLELVKHPGVALSREALTRAAQVGNYRPLDRAVDVQIARLRRKLRQADADAKWIVTARGEGYVWAPPAARESKERRYVKLLPLPMFGRIFIALLVMTISALILIAATFSDYQERVTALTLAPMWAAAIRTEQEQPGAPRRELDLRMRIHVLSGCATARRPIQLRRIAARSR